MSPNVWPIKLPNLPISPRDHSGKGPWSSKALKFRLVPAGSIMTPCGIFLKIASPTTPAKKTLFFGECFWCFSLCQVRKCCNLAIYIYTHLYYVWLLQYIYTLRIAARTYFYSLFPGEVSEKERWFHTNLGNITSKASQSHPKPPAQGLAIRGGGRVNPNCVYAATMHVYAYGRPQNIHYALLHALIFTHCFQEKYLKRKGDFTPTLETSPQKLHKAIPNHQPKAWRLPTFHAPQSGEAVNGEKLASPSQLGLGRGGEGQQCALL